MRTFCGILFWIFVSNICFAQVAGDYAVRVTAVADTSVPFVKLIFPHWPTATGYSIYKKDKDAEFWGTAIATLTGADSTYTDYAVDADSAYEYRVARAAGSITAYGYIYAGIRFPAREQRGTAIIIVDSTFSDSLSAELHRLMEDISGDGWAVIRHDVPRDTTVTYVRSLIISDYNADPLNVRALFLVGHVPVPYSGDLNPDGHPDHKGAWPADGYYADVDGTYSDISVNDTSASRTANRNVPGDGKFDQTFLPTSVELMTGRVDVANMPAFGLSESVMLRRYLDRDHAYRNAVIRVDGGGLIDDNFGAFSGEAFAANAWRNFPPLLGDTAVKELDFFTTLQFQPYLWSYGCGGGWYEGAGGVGATADFAADSVQSIFIMMFGSYFGDWDAPNDFLRAPLASRGLPLTCCWAGRPNWQFHHMAMGEPAGYAAKWAMNNGSTYVSNYGAGYVHIALMGDPTIRLRYIAPPQQVVADPVYPVEVTWTSSPDSVDGYLIFRSDSEFGVYERVSPQPIHGNVFYDYDPINGLNYYMVRALEYSDGPSGSYYNISTGVKDTTFIDVTSARELHELKVSIYPNPSHGDFTVYLSDGGPETEADITDLQGRTVFKEKYAAEGTNTMLHISSGLGTPGIYLLRLSNEKGTLVRRIAVMK